MAGALREIFANFTAKFDTKQVEHGAHKVEGLTQKLHHLGAALGVGFLVHRLEQFTHGLIETTAEIAQTADQIGIGTTALQELRFAADAADVPIEALHTGLFLLQKNAVAAGKSGSAMAKAFKALGVEVKGADGQFKSVDQLLEEVADGLHNVDDPTRRLALQMQIFGRGGKALGPLFKEGAAGVEKLREELQELGGGFSEEQIIKGREAEDSIKKLKAAWMSTKAVLADILLPAVRAAGDWLAKTVGHFAKLAKHVDIGRLAFLSLGTVLGGVLLTKLPVLIGFLKSLITKQGLLRAGALAAVLAIDSLATSFEGGKSKIREFFLELSGGDFDINDWLDPLVDGVNFFSEFVIGTFRTLFLGAQNIWFRIGDMIARVLGTMGIGSGAAAFKKQLEANQLAQDVNFGRAGDLMRGTSTGNTQAQRLLKRIQTQAISGTPVQNLSPAQRSLVMGEALRNPSAIARGTGAATVNAVFQISGVKTPLEFAKLADKHLKTEMRKAHASLDTGVEE
jgi:hypothetical protein